MSPPTTTHDDPNARRIQTQVEYLRTELNNIIYWRRLLKDRIDLVVAQMTPPPPLGKNLNLSTQRQFQCPPPPPEYLHGLIETGSETGDPAELIQELKQAERSLAEYFTRINDLLFQAQTKLHHRQY